MKREVFIQCCGSGSETFGRIRIRNRIRNKSVKKSLIFRPKKGNFRQLWNISTFSRNNLIRISIFALHPGSPSRNLSILTPKQQKKKFLSSRKYDPGCSSRIRMLTFYPSRIQGSRDQKGTGSRIRCRNTAKKPCKNTCALGKSAA
jgi:hypothetical protein